MTPEVEEAIREIAEAYPTSSLETADDGQGGAFVTVKGVPIEGPYVQNTTWFGFHITHTYPYADVYPHFVRLLRGGMLSHWQTVPRWAHFGTSLQSNFRVAPNGTTPQRTRRFSSCKRC